MLPKTLKIIILSGSLAVLLFIVIAIFPGPLKQGKIVVLNRGGVERIAYTLQQEGIVHNAKIFWVIAQITKIFGPIKAGEYF